ncbi:tannase/feruloyl esterase family alpha/beta hydrolase [Amycolatopsis sp. FDAARGOS 1241]|uniref:tannase/feruloyl esterase family alpha/beta hydrolase n=1 Tax=Amycolatopsis sp. FDAARGOS 1241 TaxID=2778070 RepID=UPI00194F898E|nr:tannase/feruloyl esterase family alpha/beta hydrolase [Amycolatopsis sp. FDAARGOS 1241]QRP49076.1 tannase/feruloyl esterase family alpha/beta hydrolase [Amycolatopsis sp. FDAARGOS 1241]
MKRPTRIRLAGALVLVVAAAVSAVTAVQAQATGDHHASHQPRRSCESLVSARFANTTIVSATAVEASKTAPAYCDVQATVTNAPAYTDSVKIGVFLPISTWNGSFQGMGGGGFSGGDPTNPDSAALAGGYVTAGSDTGHPDKSGSFALRPDGTPDWQAIDDFGYVGIHEMTVLAKQLTKAYYGQAPAYSYFNGCSTGGRQGLIEAQRYPRDYNGISAGSPAINSNKLRAAQMWGQMQMQLAGDFIPQCKLAAFNAAATVACDKLDGVADGIISDWQGCHFDARTVIGQATPCGTVTAIDADIVNKIWQGPVDPKGNPLWFGLQPGASFGGLNNTVTAADGTTTGSPFGASDEWYRYFLARDPKFDWRTITYPQFLDFFQQASSEYTDLDVTSSATPDLSSFKAAGGKIVMWSGTYDPLVYQLGDLDYVQRVRDVIGGAKQTDQFLRFFFAPGVGHCGGGAGAAPTDQFQAVVDWVQHGKPPAQLAGAKTDAAGKVTMTRPICAYPQVARYRGGDPNTARSFTCANDFGRIKN